MQTLAGLEALAALKDRQELLNIAFAEVDGQPIIIDAGVKVTGGWSAAREILNLLLAGKGTVQFGDMRKDAHRLVTVDVFWDRFPDQWREIPVAGGATLTTLVGDGERTQPIALLSNSSLPDLQACQRDFSWASAIVVASPGSLVHSIFTAVRALYSNLGCLAEKGFKEAFLWGWGTCPIAPYPTLIDEYSRNGAICSFWLESDDAALSLTTSQPFEKGEVRLHSYTTGRTFICGSVNYERIYNSVSS
jgi:hypothetical protein